MYQSKVIQNGRKRLQGTVQWFSLSFIEAVVPYLKWYRTGGSSYIRSYLSLDKDQAKVHHI